MKLHTALGTGMIVAGGVATVISGVRSIDHNLKLRAAAEEYRISDQWSDHIRFKRGGIYDWQLEPCKRTRESGEPRNEILQNHCEYYETYSQQLEEQLNKYDGMQRAAAIKMNYHRDEFWTHAGITALSLFAAAAGYAVRKDFLSKGTQNPK